MTQGATMTISVAMRDQFGNPVLSLTPPANFTLTATGAGGTIGAVTCNASTGICTATYTAPAAAGVEVISAKIGGTEILLSPVNVTIN